MDRRISKTTQSLKDALVTLMEEKELRKITVSDITKLANINRGTFYLHYLDIYDMVEKLEDEIINKIKEIIDTGNNLATNYLYLPILVKIIEYFYQDKRFIQTLISPNGDPFFLGRVQDIMVEHSMKIYHGSLKKYDASYIKVIMTFIVSGGIGVFTEWFKGGCETPIHEVIIPCETIISKGLNNL